MGSEQHKTNTGFESNHSIITRREMLAGVAGTAMGLTSCMIPGNAPGAGNQAATKGRINQSIALWCFEKYWNLEKMCQIATQLGCLSIELVEPENWPVLKKHGLVCALTSSHGFEQGMNNPKYHDMCMQKIRDSIDACSEYNFPSVITFTGFREDIPNEQGIKNCVLGYKKIIGYAEKKKVNLCLEILNSRVGAEMKGHPGYQGDHVDYCMEIIKQVGSPRMKLLFDIYHVQVMDGDIISRIRQYKDYTGHYHTAGNPGRCEIDDSQEINYPAIMKEIVKTGYKGYVGQEFIPTRDPLKSLTEAVRICDV